MFGLRAPGIGLSCGVTETSLDECTEGSALMPATSGPHRLVAWVGLEMRVPSAL